MADAHPSSVPPLADPLAANIAAPAEATQSQSLLKRMLALGTGRTAKHALGTLFLQAGSIAIRLVLGVVLARTLGAEKYGIYTYVTALVLVLHVPAALGLPQLLVREVAVLLERDQPGLLRGLLKTANRWVLGAATLISLSLLAASLWRGQSWSSPETASLWLGLILLPLLSLCAIQQGALQGLGHILPGQVSLLVIQPGLLLGIALCAYLFLGPSQLSAPLTVAAHVFAAFIALLCSSWLLHRNKPKALASSPSLYRPGAWFRSAVPFFGLAGLVVLSGRIDVVMVGWFRPPDEVGIYRAAVTAGSVVLFGLEALNMAIAPRLARMWENKEIPGLQQLATRSAWSATLYALPFFFLFAFAGDLALGLAFGEEFAVGSTALLIIGTGQVINAAFGSVSVLLNMTGHQRWTLIGLAVAAVVNLSLNAWLTPLHGIIGAAIASTAALAAWKIILFIQVRRVLGVNASILGVLPMRRAKSI